MLAVVRSTDHRSTWARWSIVDDTGEPVGSLVDEERQGAGSRYGPPTYVAVHNPAALAALQAHLDAQAGSAPPAA